MNRVHSIYKVFFILLLCTSWSSLVAQTYLVPYSGSDAFTTCSGILYDHAGTGNYSNYADGYATIYPSNPGDFVRLSGTISGETCCDYLYIYDGVGLSGTLLWQGVASSGTVPQVTSLSGPLTVRFTSDVSVVGQGFALNISCCDACSCGNGPTNVRVLSSGSNFIEVTWTANAAAPQYLIEYGPVGFIRGTGTVVVTPNNTYTITGLTNGEQYDIYVYYDCDGDGSTAGETPVQITGCAIEQNNCINYTALTGAGVTCTYGSYSSPYSYNGVVNGRHTVMSPSDGYDPYSSSRLTCVSPCDGNSVRLGRYNSGNEAESITYSYVVDTTQYDYLILKYAAVLYQMSGYASSSQPRFSFKILNNNGVELNPTCNNFEYIAGYNTTGWNQYSSYIFWKDWTVHSVDLTPYHGQTILIRLVTQHGSSSSYFGYAYYTLSCGGKYKLENNSCGAASQLDFSAPPGFGYRWYLGSNPNQTLSSNQSVTVAASSTDSLYCVISSLNNPTCNFTLSTDMTSKFPLADFSIQQRGCSFTYNLINQSTTSLDGITPDGTGSDCETYYWDFGNGQTSTNENPSVTYDSAGTYTITLVAGIKGDQCLDTMVQVLQVAEFDPVLVGDTLSCAGVNRMLIVSDGVDFNWSTGDSTAYIIVAPTTNTTYTVTTSNGWGCTKTLQLTMRIKPSYNTTYDVTLCEGDSYNDNGFNLQNLTQLGTTSYTLPMLTSGGCDSIITLNLTVNPLPTVNLGEDFSICFDKSGSIYLDAGGEYDEYLWNTGETNRFISVRDSGLYSLTATLNGCQATDQIFISDNCPLNFYLPNTITPYYPDGINDYFMLSNTGGIRSLEINIYDRWGKLVFESKDINFKWDGKVNGEIHPNQTFTYRLWVMGTDTKRYVIRGSITVL